MLEILRIVSELTGVGGGKDINSSFDQLTSPRRIFAFNHLVTLLAVQSKYSITNCARNSSNSFGVNRCRRRERQKFFVRPTHISEKNIRFQSPCYIVSCPSHIIRQNAYFMNIFPKGRTLISSNFSRGLSTKRLCVSVVP